MQQRSLGSSGMAVTLVGLGCNNFGRRTDVETSRRVIHKALELGITLFDTADVYGGSGSSETILGLSLGERRKEIILASKFGMPMNDAGTLQGASRSYILSAVEDSLRRLRTDWIDLYQIHQPDPQTPIEETLRALEDLVQQGKVRHIGCSNFPAWQMVEAQWTARHHGLHGLICCQDEYSLLVRHPERELIPAMKAYGLSLLPYFPLASGLLTGKYKRDRMPAGARLTASSAFAGRFLTEANWQAVDALETFCAARGRSLLELAFSWLAAQPLVASIIAGATRPEQVEQNVEAVEWALTPDDLAEIDRITKAVTSVQ
ncbi:MAG: aldo/keto reductase [Acidobacteria bacterium RIFCSPLOWO2_02_FULL_60_20]|nr:MAG: aldo/keto reductase [Acidobacteria bacterium RIFCSPLOWO2_02_FULL_60_20]